MNADTRFDAREVLQVDAPEGVFYAEPLVGGSSIVDAVDAAVRDARARPQGYGSWPTCYEVVDDVGRRLIDVIVHEDKTDIFNPAVGEYYPWDEEERRVILNQEATP